VWAGYIARTWVGAARIRLGEKLEDEQRMHIVMDHFLTEIGSWKDLDLWVDGYCHLHRSLLFIVVILSILKMNMAILSTLYF
jgi:hypothetical protein